MATESSVVVALKEVRRLEIDRQRREEESRRAQEQERLRADSNERASVQYGPGMQPFGQGFGGPTAAMAGSTSPRPRVSPGHCATPPR